MSYGKGRRANLAKLKVVARVTSEHGERFATKWLEATLGGTGTPFDAAGVIQWPEAKSLQWRYQQIEDEINEVICREVKPVISETFVRAAREALARERAWRRHAYIAVTRRKS